MLIGWACSFGHEGFARSFIWDHIDRISYIAGRLYSRNRGFAYNFILFLVVGETLVPKGAH